VFVTIAAANSPIKQSQSLLLEVMIELPSHALLTQKADARARPSRVSHLQCDYSIKWRALSIGLGANASMVEYRIVKLTSAYLEKAQTSPRRLRASRAKWFRS
jgi:hypothetical protein